MLQRNLTPEESQALQTEISLYIDATQRKRDFMDKLMLEVSLIKPGDFLYAKNAMGDAFRVLGVVYKLERPWAEKQFFLMDNSPNCHYVYLAPSRLTARQWVAGEKIPEKDNVPESFNTNMRDHPGIFTRQELIDSVGEEYVVDIEKKFLTDYPWAQHSVDKFKQKEPV